MAEGEDGVTVAWDLNSIKEEEFEKHVVYIVPDLPVDSECPNRAEKTLPRNLVLKPSQALSDVSSHLERELSIQNMKLNTFEMN